MHHFQIKFKDTDDIYIVNVEYRESLEAAKERAREIIEKTILNRADFEIKELISVGDLVSQLHFVDGIAQIEIVRNP